MKLMVFTLATRPIFAQSSHSIATIAAYVFLVPMLLFSFPAGFLVDRFCRRRLVVFSKILDVILLSIATLSLFFYPYDVIIPFTMLGFLGISSALFNPAKGCLLPEILGSDKLCKGNGLLEMWTMLAVFAGYALGPSLLSLDQGGVKGGFTWIGPFILTVIALMGLLAALFLPKVQGEKEIQKKATIRQVIQSVWKDYPLVLMLIGNVIFWVVITYMGQNVLVETKELVRNWRGSEIWQGIPLAAYWFGIAVGSLAGGRLPVNKISTGPKTLAVVGFSLIWAILRFTHPDFFGTSMILLLMGFAAGFLIVPIMAIIQYRAPRDQRGSILAFNNVLNIIGILLGSYIAFLVSNVAMA